MKQGFGQKANDETVFFHAHRRAVERCAIEVAFKTLRAGFSEK